MARIISLKTDTELLECWRDGDTRAFNILFERYFYKLFRFASRHTGDTALAEEMVMDVLLKLWLKKDLLQGQTLSPFLFHLLKATLIDHYRKKKLEFAELESEPEHPEQTDDLVLYKDLQNIYKQSIAQLSPQKQRVLQLKHEGLTYREIALALNISTKTVDRHLSDSMSTLRKLIQKIYFLF